MTPRRAGFLAGGLVSVSLLWGAALLWRVDGHLAARARAHYVSEGNRLVSAAAFSLSDRWPGVDVPLRRLAAEPDSRYALLLNARGEVISAEGAAPDLHELGRRPAAGVWELSGEPLSYAFVQPLWTDGKPLGALVWARWAAELPRERRADRRALAVVFVWWALAGALLCFWIWRGKGPWTRPGLGGR